MFKYFFNICLEINRIRISYNYACIMTKKNRYGNISYNLRQVINIYIKESKGTLCEILPQSELVLWRASEII